jgi:anaerobic selenocysteine-containing dehydrogenase
LIVGGAAGSLFTPVMWKVTDDISIWTQNWPWVPKVNKGQIERKPSLSALTNNGAGIRVVTVGGQPVTVEGNPDHPLSRGGVDALAANEVKLQYSPARLKGPMKNNGDGTFSSIGWDEAQNMLASKVKAAGARTAAISGDVNGSTAEILAGFLKGLGSDDFYYMPTDAQAYTQAWQNLMNGQGQVGYDIENSDFVLMIGADALESWGTSVRNRAALKAAKPVGAESATTFAYAGPSVTRSAAVSKVRVPVKPGDEATFAMGLAFHLLRMGANVNTADFADFKAVVQNRFAPAKVENAIGIKHPVLADLARRLAYAKRPVVIAGSPSGQGMGQAAFVAGMALNMLLNRLNTVGGVNAVPEIPTVVNGAPTRSAVLAKDTLAWIEGLSGGGKPQVLLVHEANPAYALPGADAAADALASVPFKVSFSPFMDETAAMCDLILPNPLTIERFQDSATPLGSGYASYSAVAPAAKPAADVRPTGDLVLELAGKLGVDLGFATFEEVVKAKAKALEAGGYLSSLKAPWEALADGIAPVSGSDLYKGLLAGNAWVSIARVSQSGLSLAPAVLSRVANAQITDSSYPVALVGLNMENIGSAKVAIPPHNTVTIDNDQMLDHQLVVSISAATAAKYGFKDGAKVEVASPQGSVPGVVLIDEAVMPGVAVAPLWLGRTAWDKFAQGKGANLFKVLAASQEAGTGAAMWSGSKVKITKI